RANVHAICGRDAGKAAKVAAENDVPHVHTDYGELIDRGDLDAVVIGTPDHLHHEMVLRAAAAGLHVVCEKPLAQSLEQAREMAQAVESAGRNGMTFYTYGWLPHYQRLKQLSQEYVGRILSADFKYLTPGVPEDSAYDWHYDPRLGTGILGNLASHVIYLAGAIVGDIESVAAMTAVQFNRLGETNADVEQLPDSVTMVVRYAGGALGSIQAGYSVAPGGQEQLVTIHGEEGTLQASLDDPGGIQLRGGRSGDDLALIAGTDDLWDGIDLSQDQQERFIEYYTSRPVGIRRFIDDIHSDTPSRPSLQDGVRVQAVLEAARLSAQTGRTQDVVQIN
ncbi:MAG: Gfo/Idh/MocA family oxidoreductase, partial [Gemmatimonadetes bacterium]|nr:Gfo/Idh/MocA family oxidoreductase [Gemmatimonadota bacterium]